MGSTTASAAAPDSSPSKPSTAAAMAGPELVAEGDSWRVGFMGRTVRVRDMKGIGDLAVLFARPGVEVHALELMGGQDVGGAAGPALDEQARRDYQARIVELQHDIDEARGHNDIARADRAELELDALVEQLSEAFGLGDARGPPDPAPSAPAPPSPIASARRSASSTNSTPTSGAISPTRSVPAPGARTGPRPRWRGRSSAADSQCEDATHVSCSSTRTRRPR